MSKINSTYVGPSGPEDAQIMIVGEAPGKDEEIEGRPFVGKSGELLNRYLQRHGVQREDVFVTNLAKFRPYRNNFKHLVGSDQLEEGLKELKEEISTVDPNVIVAMGNWPLYHLTGKTGSKGKAGTGITSWRGSRLPTTPVWGPQRKVYASYHPAYILRLWSLNPILHHDIGAAVADSEFPELRYPQYESIIDPSVEELRELVRSAEDSNLVSMDIETFRSGGFSCIGFCWSDEIGVCVTYQNPRAHDLLRQLWESDVPKCFQFGTYDVSFMRRFYDWQIGGFYRPEAWDTYIAAASLMPEFPRGLDFLASIYTRFPYYKQERKVWKKKDDMSILWEYNIKDIIATYQIAIQQREEIAELFKEAA